MKIAKSHSKDTKPKMVYQQADLPKIEELLNRARIFWIQEWKELGSKDYGTCTTGKGIRIPYLRKGKRYYQDVLAVEAPPVQGNTAASDAVTIPLEFLRKHGIDCYYDDGSMD